MSQSAPADTIDIAWCCDGSMISGLAVSVWSALKNLETTQPVRVWIVDDGIDPNDRKQLETIVSRSAPTVSFQFIPAKYELPADAILLHGGRTAYTRLFLCDLLPNVDKVLYLDSDILVTGNLSNLFNCPVESWIGAVLGGPAINALDHGFLIEIAGLKEDTPVFNSGVLILDLAKIRAEGINLRFNAMLGKHGSELTSHDQSVLNAVSAGTFSVLPKEWNTTCLPAVPAPNPEIKGIFHFVGRPKPWDVGSRWLHPSGPLWRKALLASGWKSSPLAPKNASEAIRSTWLSRRSILRQLRRKLVERK